MPGVLKAAPAAPRAGASVGLSLGEARPTRAGPALSYFDQPALTDRASDATRCHLLQRADRPAPGHTRLVAPLSIVVRSASPNPDLMTTRQIRHL